MSYYRGLFPWLPRISTAGKYHGTSSFLPFPNFKLTYLKENRTARAKTKRGYLKVVQCYFEWRIKGPEKNPLVFVSQFLELCPPYFQRTPCLPEEEVNLDFVKCLKQACLISPVKAQLLEISNIPFYLQCPEPCLAQ